VTFFGSWEMLFDTSGQVSRDKEHTEQSKEAHRDECKGQMGIAPQSYRSTRHRAK
jgi:hypothetical protein